MIPKFTDPLYEAHKIFVARSIKNSVSQLPLTGEVPIRNFRTPGIYLLVNMADFSVYVGQAQDLRKRFYEHKNDLARLEHRNDHLQKAWKKYGVESFTFVVCETHDLGDLDFQEQSFLGALFGPYCYNICPLVRTRRGVKSTEAHRQKISQLMNRPEIRKAASERMKKKWEDPDFRAHMANRMSSPEVVSIKRKASSDPSRGLKVSQAFKRKREQRLALLPPKERVKAEKELERSRKKALRQSANKKLAEGKPLTEREKEAVSSHTRR